MLVVVVVCLCVCVCVCVCVYQMEITAGPTYYPYSSFIYTPNKNEDFIVAAMMPIFGENASNVGRTNMEAESEFIVCHRFS